MAENHPAPISRPTTKEAGQGIDPALPGAHDGLDKINIDIGKLPFFAILYIYA